jgi:REP element-mobilizing transposase RayT
MRTDEACEFDFRSKGPYWHVYTPGDLTEIIFTSPEDFIFGMNLMAVCLALFPRLRIVTFTLMNNHIHIILAGSREDSLSFFALYRKRLKRFLAGQGRYPDLSALVPDAYEIPDLQALRNEIVYVNRNGYVVQPEHTPYSYPWSAGVFYFNPLLVRIPSIRLSALSQPEQRRLYHSRLIELPDHYAVTGQMITPSSFCSIQEGEAYYRNAHQYFQLLSRNQEAGSGIAKRLADTAFLTDEELFGVARTLAARDYGIKNPGALSPDAKNALAKKLYFDYKAAPRQIRRLLKMDPAVLEALFPAPNRKREQRPIRSSNW